MLGGGGVSLKKHIKPALGLKSCTSPPTLAQRFYP